MDFFVHTIFINNFIEHLPFGAFFLRSHSFRGVTKRENLVNEISLQFSESFLYWLASRIEREVYGSVNTWLGSVSRGSGVLGECKSKSIIRSAVAIEEH